MRAHAMVLAVFVPACLSTPNRPAERIDAQPDSSDGVPTMHVAASSMVDQTGLVNVGNAADGNHHVFVDNTPGKNGNLVIIEVGDTAPSIRTYVSMDQGASWTRHIITPPSTNQINDLGACQDSNTHAFHLTWLDSSNSDQYARFIPTYTGGDISGFTVSDNFQFFDEGSDSPGPRDLAEVIDNAGNHHILFVGSGTSAGSEGLFKLAVTSVTAGVAPTSQNDFRPATAASPAGGDDQLLPNNYATGDTTDTFMAGVSSNLAGGSTAPVVVVAGLPVDHKLLAWILKPTSNGQFSVTGPQTLSSSFGAGDGIRAHASLSLASAPSGDVWIVYNEDGASPAPGLHVAKMDLAGTLMRDAAPQPITSTTVRHAVIATDSTSHPAVMYYDGSGSIVATLLWNGAWLPTVSVAAASDPIGAWSISNPWQAPKHAFGYFRDASSSTSTTFSSIEWQ